MLSNIAVVYYLLNEMEVRISAEVCRGCVLHRWHCVGVRNRDRGMKLLEVSWSGRN